MNLITSGVDPIPYNPAIVAPMTPLLLENGVLFWDANSFELTTLQPSIDLTAVPVTWTLNVTSGLLNPTAEVVVALDQRSARLEIPFPSWGNLGDGRMEFRIGGDVCADVETLIKNVQPDLESGDFRFQVKAHLCTDGAGTSTSRTEAEVRTIMSDVTKVLSQCGIIVTMGSIAATVVPSDYLDLGTTFERNVLFGIDEDETAIDIYFVRTIEGGNAAGDTLSPFASGVPVEAGIAISDAVGPTQARVPIVGQNAVRLVSHEIAHYLLNHFFGDSDHHADDDNLMFDDTVDYKRELDEGQCLEMRSNYGVD